jgi:DNA-binding CsgD family transcriptional regulator
MEASTEPLRGLVVVNRDGFVDFAADATRAAVARYVGPFTENRLPAPLGSWLEGTLARHDDAPFVVDRDGRHLVVRRFATPAVAEVVLLVTESERGHPGLRRRYQLTPRESEILWWVTEGKTNREIALVLGCSARTVQLHLNHVYRKLGVETRTAAAAVAFRASLGRAGVDTPSGLRGG